MVDSKDNPDGETAPPEASTTDAASSSAPDTAPDDTASKSKHKPLTETESQLLAEIQNGDVDQVVSLLAAGASVNCLDNHGMTPLMQAAHKGIKSLIVTSLFLFS